MFILVQFLVLVIIRGFVYRFGCSLLFFIFYIFYFFLLFIFLILLLLFFSFFSSFSSEPCGWQDLGCVAGYQASAYKAGEASSGN